MSTNGTPNATSHTAPEQLSLLTTPSVPLQFRLDERTRRSGLQHVAELRALIAAQAADRRGGAGRTGSHRTGRAADRQIAA